MAGSVEWCTRCMSGVTITFRRMASTRSGNLTLEWLNIEVPLSTISKIRTETTGAPRAMTMAAFHSMESRISSGWKRSAVVTSKPVSA